MFEIKSLGGDEFYDVLTPTALEDADIILKSCDDGLFHAHIWLLSKLSPVFADMFEVIDIEDSRRLSIVAMAETKLEIGYLLLFAYPPHMLAASPTSIQPQRSNITTVFELSRKFDLKLPHEWACRALMKRSSSDATWVYCIAYKYGLGSIFRGAAVDSLREPFLPDPNLAIFREIPANVLSALYQFRLACKECALKALPAEDKYRCTCSTTTSALRRCNYHDGRDCGSFRSGCKGVPLPYWKAYVASARKALEARPHMSSVNEIEVIESLRKTAALCKLCAGHAALHLDEDVEMAFNLVQVAILKKVRPFVFKKNRFNTLIVT
jgi:hypothetical protein